MQPMRGRVRGEVKRVPDAARYNYENDENKFVFMRWDVSRDDEAKCNYEITERKFVCVRR